MRLSPLEGSIGVELLDVDLTKPLPDTDIDQLRRAFQDHLLVLVRGQALEGDDHDRFVKYLGPLHQFDAGGYFEYMTNVEIENKSPAGAGRLLFHNDGAYRERPRAGTSLYAIDVSPTSPPTSFASGVHAFESLPRSIQTDLEKLTAVHILDLDDPKQEAYRVREADFPRGRFLQDVRHAVHPVVVTLPHSGRKSLFVSEFYTSHIVEFGPTSDEGEALLQEAFSALYAQSNTYSHHYTVGDLVVWDNLALQHARSGTVGSSPRHLRRLVLKSLDW
ncbi:TauD/TfdA dioxygenase family protein [Williamsia muralis]|nr:TauD/TfdA family dioxygenase [Williamsia marianensis]